MSDVIQRWHEILKNRDVAGLNDLLAEDVVFHSPVVHTPQKGKVLTTLYLGAAMRVIANDSFTYVREVIDGDNAVLEFTTEVNGIVVNGVDMIHWNKAGQIDDFKVMIRPLKAINLLHEMMGMMLKNRG